MSSPKLLGVIQKWGWCLECLRHRHGETDTRIYIYMICRSEMIWGYLGSLCGLLGSSFSASSVIFGLTACSGPYTYSQREGWCHSRSLALHLFSVQLKGWAGCGSQQLSFQQKWYNNIISSCKTQPFLNDLMTHHILHIPKSMGSSAMLHCGCASKPGSR